MLAPSVPSSLRVVSLPTSHIHQLAFGGDAHQQPHTHPERRLPNLLLPCCPLPALYSCSPVTCLSTASPAPPTTCSLAWSLPSSAAPPATHAHTSPCTWRRRTSSPPPQRTGITPRPARSPQAAGSAVQRRAAVTCRAASLWSLSTPRYVAPLLPLPLFPHPLLPMLPFPHSCRLCR